MKKMSASFLVCSKSQKRIPLRLFDMKKNRGQIKIQEMAFVLVALMIFFAIAGLIYLSVKSNQIKTGISDQKEDAIKEEIRFISGRPEIIWAGCEKCIDFDKVFIVKDKIIKKEISLEDLRYDYLAIEFVYPQKSGGECNKANYPNCNFTTVINSGQYGRAESTFVNLCYWDSEMGNTKCELGKIYASIK